MSNLKLLSGILCTEALCMELKYELAMDRVNRGLTEALPLVHGLYDDYGDERILALYNVLQISIDILN